MHLGFYIARDISPVGVCKNQNVAGSTLNLPPSINITLPVQYAPARLVRNSIAPAMSSSVPTLSRGILSLGKIPSPIIPAASSEGNT